MKKLQIILIITLLFFLFPLTVQSEEFFIEDLDTFSYVSIRNIGLIWWPDTYTPYEYKGRTLPSLGSKIAVEAIVDIAAGDADTLKYSWFLDNTFQRSKSGYGKNEFYFYVQQRPDNYHIVKVQIFNENRSVFEEKFIEIPVVEPELVVYPSNGNAHFSERTDKVSFVLADKEFSFIAKPYFFSIKRMTDLEFEWRFPGQEPIISSD
ncbi:MAG: hypothetical protein C0412_20370, partial [Flavobacterium sp.]|nr:hypothetical protein [Flavobacterium sp.]